MADLGLILGAGLAGGMAGAGQAGGAALHTEQENQDKQDLATVQSQLEEQKDLRIMEAAQVNTAANQQAGFAHEDTTQANAQQFQGGQGDLNRANNVTLTGMNNATSIQAATIGASAATTDATIMANASMANAQLAAANRSIQTLGDGRIVSIGRDPTSGQLTTQQLLDPTSGKPMIGMKNLNQASVLLAQSLMQEAQHQASMGLNDEATKNYTLAQSVLQGKDIGAALNPAKMPTPQDIAALTRNGTPTPLLQAQYDKKYGVGAAAAAVSAAQASAAPAAAGGPAATNPVVPSLPAAAPISAAVPVAAGGTPSFGTAPSPFAAPTPALGSGMAVGSGLPTPDQFASAQQPGVTPMPPMPGTNTGLINQQLTP